MISAFILCCKFHHGEVGDDLDVGSVIAMGIVDTYILYGIDKFIGG